VTDSDKHSSLILAKITDVKGLIVQAPGVNVINLFMSVTYECPQ
jgi:hypothetical protein